MAALDHRNPNLDDFVGLNWSCWVDRVNVLTPDAETSAEDSIKYARNHCETMTLRKEDMHIYGQCPAYDDVLLVVCSHCDQLVKPQAFEKHCERRHSPLTKMCSQSCTVVPQQRPRPGQPINISSSREREKDSQGHETGPPLSAELSVYQHRPPKAQKQAVSLPSAEKYPQESPIPHKSSSMPLPRVPNLHSGPLPSGLSTSSTSSSEKAHAQKPTAGQLNQSASPLRGMRTYSRIYKNTGSKSSTGPVEVQVKKEKECDLNKHCFGVDRERKKLWSRKLVCNNDDIHQQQRVSGAPQGLDQLAVEQRTAGGDTEKVIKSKERKQHSEALEEKRISSCRKYNINSNCHILSRSRGPLESSSDEDRDSTLKVEVQPPYPFNQKLVSSGESESDEPEDATDLPATSWHPKPLGLCTFGCRTLGCSIFTFDRRLHHLRVALSAMLEHHVSTHLWKTMPEVSSGLRPPVRTGTRCSNITESSSLESTSLGHPETKSSPHTHITNTTSSCTTKSLQLGWQRQPVTPTSGKQEGTLRDASAKHKAATFSNSRDSKSSRSIRDPLLHEKAQPKMTSSHRPFNCIFSQGKKPLQPSERHLSSPEKRSALSVSHQTTHSSPHCIARPPGIQKKASSYDHKAGQKRKVSSGSQPLSPSLSRTFKCQRLSSPPCSSLLSWKRKSINDVVSLGSEKKSDP